MMTLHNDDIDILRGKKVSIALGVFDGVHAGHRKLLETLNACAATSGSASVAYTFDNHPEEVLFGNAPKYIDTFEEKAAKIEALGVAYLWAVTFTKDMASLKPETFIKLMTEPLDIKDVIVGYDYSFGDKGTGRAKDLEDFGEIYHFKTWIVPAILDNGLPVSSSRIREMIASGDMDTANRLLCSTYKIRGEINSGRKIGTQLGFPTANIQYDADKVLPGNGVYLTRIHLDGKNLPSITNVGCNPTIGTANAITIETYIMHFNKDIYGYTAEVEFLKRLRPEMKFPDRENLAMQIQKDVATAKAYFGE